MYRWYARQARAAPRRRLPISPPRSEKPAEYGDVLCIVRRTSPHPFVSEPVKLTKKDLGFWIGMALWIGPPLLPLLVLIVFSIRDLHWQGPPATVGHHATAEAPAKLSNASSNGIGSADERHSKRNVPSTRRRSSALLEEISSTQRSPEPFFWSAERPAERWKPGVTIAAHESRTATASPTSYFDPALRCRSSLCRRRGARFGPLRHSLASQRRTSCRSSVK